jgi:large subunit ribosomal protein L4
MPGGAVVHGPQPRDYRQGINKQVKQLALKVALSERCRHHKLYVIDDLAVSKYSTKEVKATIEAIAKSSRSTLLSDERKDDFLYKSSRNIHGATSITPAELNAEHVLRYESIILTETALSALKQRFEGGAQ